MGRKVVMVVALVAALLAAAASASGRTTKADMGFMVGGPLPNPLPTSSSFSPLMSGAPMHYQRIGVAWDQFGTTNGSQCVAPTQTNSEPGIFISDVAKAEQLGETPLVVIGPDIWQPPGYQWPTGAQPATTPDDQQYRCGVQLLMQTLAAKGLSRTGMPVEAFNEPDNSSYYVAPSQAASYFGDLVAVGGSQVHAIAGVFESPYDDNNGYLADLHYATDYVSALKSSGYNGSATSWSFHDFSDVVDPNTVQYCSPSDLSRCVHAGVSHFLAWLQGQGEPTRDVWLTESGDASASCCGTWLTHSRSEEAHTAYGWEQLRPYVEHMFWYQFQTFNGDTWDSALVAAPPPTASGQPRPSYCVIAFNETPSRALSDSRCFGG